MAQHEDTPASNDIAKRVAWYNNLSTRLLVLTIVFVMLAEVLIWTPSAARYRKNFMEDYIDRAYLSMLALGNLPNAEANAALEMKLLDQAEARAIIVQTSLRQKGRLAALGAGMAKINHDLRNTLATAVLVSDRLKLIEDPEVKRVTPRLMRAIDRAIELCSQTLNYASDDSLTIRHSRFDVFGLVDEVRMELDPNSDEDEVIWLIDIDPAMEFWADRRQMNRAVHNLCANAIQAGSTELRIKLERDSSHSHLTISDNGPGLPEKSKENLFKPFAGSSRKGGTGLGLVIVRDVVSAHGGKVELLRTDDTGTSFRISIPRQHPTREQEISNVA